eukprot:TRINITY_DN1682_c0_g1_i1.p1 TRINITY_DN1682_c0_g1~~TRINITY_DN1682_c0_g1_i1.p1  ORF type:complete len:110 (-),score=20.63 TRINITY_DN1682_c0_g1_i1:82-411(-)
MQAFRGCRILGSLSSRVVAGQRAFSDKAGTAVEVASQPAAATKKAAQKPASGFTVRLRSFAYGFLISGAIGSYMLVTHVQWATDELTELIRDAANRQSRIERRLDALEK